MGTLQDKNRVLFSCAAQFFGFPLSLAIFLAFSRALSQVFVIFCLFLHIFSILGTSLCLLYSFLELFIVKNIMIYFGIFLRYILHEIDYILCC
jgi:hypothetical protein